REGGGGRVGRPGGGDAARRRPHRGRRPSRDGRGHVGAGDPHHDHELRRQYGRGRRRPGPGPRRGHRGRGRQADGRRRQRGGRVRRPPRPGERGVALLLVLWLFLVLGVLALDFARYMRDDAMAALNRAEETRGYYIALAGMNRALYESEQVHDEATGADAGGQVKKAKKQTGVTGDESDTSDTDDTGGI